MLLGLIGSDLIGGNWRIDKYPDLADIVPNNDKLEHAMGDECQCVTYVVKPTCGNCQQKHFVIIVHQALDGRDRQPADKLRDTLIRITTQPW